MIGYLKGKVLTLAKEYCLLDVNGVGYRVFVADSVRSRLIKGREAELFIYTSVREDAIFLYGFAAQADYDLFLLLISVSGIGPKGALAILSATNADNLSRAIQNQETKFLTSLPGVGKKSAQRLILELKDKIAFDGEQADDAISRQAKQDGSSEAEEALISLGYSRSEILPVLRKIKDKTGAQDESVSTVNVQEIIKQALKELNKFG